MADQEWTKVAEDKQLPEGKPLVVEHEGKEVMIVRTGGRIYAVGHECTHYGGPLSEGGISGGCVICPWHQAAFDLESGEMVRPPALNNLPRYPVKVEEGDVYLGKQEKSLFPKISRKETPRFLIVGGGAAGAAAAETLRREGFDGRILLLTAEDRGPYDRPNLSKDFLKGSIKPEWMPLRSEKFYANRDIELLLNHRVVSMDVKSHRVKLADGRELDYDKVLLATGGQPRKISIPGDDKDGFFVLRSYQDAEEISARAEASKRALILGASFIGMEAASALRSRGLEVHVAAPEKVPMTAVFGEEVGRRLQGIHEAKGVVFHMGCTAAEILGNGQVEAVVLSDGERIEADMVVAGFGITPVVDFLEGTGLVTDGAVAVDERMRSSDTDVFAAGDIASYPSNGRRRRIEHWAVAEAQGQHAARSMLGAEDPYEVVPFFWTMHFGSSVKYVGYAPSFEKIAYRGSPKEGAFTAGYYRDGKLLAAATLGKAGELILLSEMLRRGESIPFEEFESYEL
jgi:NADPH-dependent 2,4-dienoyl-CoA reductase/sulfur reductase-like enzyme/nitrite reductase/ring-hydroxylating ferredoxin subunit